jgi:Ca2+-binding EF-hand superfamily protein
VEGQTPTDAEVDEMLQDATGPINFTMFLTLFGEKMSGTDPEHEIMQAFEWFDTNESANGPKTGMADAEFLREWIVTVR